MSNKTYKSGDSDSHTTTKGKINKSTYFLQDSIEKWVNDINILDINENLFATEYSHKDEMKEYNILWQKALFNILIIDFILFSILMYGVLFGILGIIISGSIFQIIFMIILLIHIFSKNKPKIILFTSKRLIFIKSNPKMLKKIDYNEIFCKKYIRSIPWTSISSFKMGEFPILFSFGGKIFGARVMTHEFGSQKILSIQNINPFQYYKYIFGTNFLYDKMLTGPSSKESRDLSDEEKNMANSMLDGNFKLPASFSINLGIGDKETIAKIDLSFTNPYEANIVLFNEKEGNHLIREENVYLYNPLLFLGTFKPKTFTISIERDRLYKTRSAKGRFLQLLLSYFYALIVPNELDVIYSYKTGIRITEEGASQKIFSKYDLNQIEPRKLEKLGRPRGYRSANSLSNWKERKMNNKIIDFFPSPDDNDPYYKRFKIVIGTEMIGMHGFVFTYDDIANVTIYNDPIHPHSEVFVKLRTPIIYTTSDGQGHSTTHYKHGVKIQLPTEYAQRFDEWFRNVLF